MLCHTNLLRRLKIDMPVAVPTWGILGTRCLGQPQPVSKGAIADAVRGESEIGRVTAKVLKALTSESRINGSGFEFAARQTCSTGVLPHWCVESALATSLQISADASSRFDVPVVATHLKKLLLFSARKPSGHFSQSGK